MIIALKSSNNANGIIIDTTYVNNDAGVAVHVVEDNDGIGFLLNLNLIGTDINNNNIDTITKNCIEEGLKSQ